MSPERHGGEWGAIAETEEEEEHGRTHIGARSEKATTRKTTTETEKHLCGQPASERVKNSINSFERPPPFRPHSSCIFTRRCVRVR